LDALRGCSRSIDLDIALDEIITGHSSVNVVPQTPLGIKKDGNSLDGGVYAVSRGKGEYNPTQGPDFGQFREPVREDSED